MLSVIIPVLNEAENLPQLWQELSAAAATEGFDLQAIFVDDGSTDDTWAVISTLAADDPRILGVRLRRNFGKAAALNAGFQAAEGERIVTLDGDLQDDPAEIARLLAKLDEGFDVVSGWKRVRHDPWHKVWPSRVFNWLVSHITGVRLHDHNCGLKAYRREVMHEIRLYGELHRFVPVLAAAKGFRTAEVVVQHRPRVHGQSKYGVSRLSKGLLDLITVKFLIGYGQRPQHILGGAGLVAFLLGGLGMVYLAARWCLSRTIPGWQPIHLHETAALFYSLGLFVIGAQFLSIGLLGEMIAAFLIRDADTYSIGEHTSPARTTRDTFLRGNAPQAMTDVRDDPLARLRWGVYLVLIAVAVGNMGGRLLALNSTDKAELESTRIRDRLQQERDTLVAEGLTGAALDDRLAKEEARFRDVLRLQRPFLSANDRSRWLTVRSLVEQGTYEIDEVLREPNWDSIDKVQHPGRDGKPHFYSSKPPLLATLVAGEYWVIHRLTGWTLGDHPYEIGRLMLLTINVLPLVLMYLLLARLVERFGTTDWGRIFVMAAATLGTFLTTFAVTFNNHVVAAVSATVALYALVRIAYDGERRLGFFALAGLAAALTAACELPAVTLFGFVGLILLWRAPRETLVAFVPAALVVAAAFFATNWLAHDSLLPAYSHRDWYEYKNSYWLNRQGVDIGEPSRLVYALHILGGHHGVFSLTPIWLLSVWGIGTWLVSADRTRKELAAMAALITVICLTFYVGFRPQIDRNYGGVTSGFRWMFWCAPLWLVVMLPAADRLSRSIAGMSFAAALLTLSVVSASYPTWNPWTHPWLYNWMQWMGWQ